MTSGRPGPGSPASSVSRAQTRHHERKCPLRLPGSNRCGPSSQWLVPSFCQMLPLGRCRAASVTCTGRTIGSSICWTFAPAPVGLIQACASSRQQLPVPLKAVFCPHWPWRQRTLLTGTQASAGSWQGVGLSSGAGQPSSTGPSIC